MRLTTIDAQILNRFGATSRAELSYSNLCDARVMSDGVRNSGKLTVSERVRCDTAVYDECARIADCQNKK